MFPPAPTPPGRRGPQHARFSVLLPQAQINLTVRGSSRDPSRARYVRRLRSGSEIGRVPYQTSETSHASTPLLTHCTVAPLSSCPSHTTYPFVAHGYLKLLTLDACKYRRALIRIGPRSACCCSPQDETSGLLVPQGDHKDGRFRLSRAVANNWRFDDAQYHFSHPPT
ncbi:hypothetical protein BD311DRAFT_2518 [Dichomitus squalens]|uniref:Uncharacterized protein n=1 Tax=Dichomitus squalens TaxID=114155 RepID=A0A4Q9N4F4_9APHY|nr:hypothetical protein BD311DRAFT_2518 [Dichomitus squalens]